MTRLLLLCISLLILCSLALLGQGISTAVELTLYPGDSTLTLPHDFLLEKSFILQNSSDNSRLDTSAYILDRRTGMISFKDTLRSLQDTLRFIATYRYLPIGIERNIFTRELVIVTDSSGNETALAEPSKTSSNLTATNIFGRDFQRSGSITRGITVGSNRDLTLQSGLRLQFSGKITDDVEVLGALTDEQTPIQPEGTTQTIREIDNIFFEIRSPVADATLGKFFASNDKGEYTSYSRKLQGAKAHGKFGDMGSTQVVAAVSPGKFKTEEFQGREGDQGPYQLTGLNGERDIVVLAGTERVFIDGIEMIRGRDNDYVIDYGTGEVFFQPQRPITGFNEIVIDFEFSDRQYSRSFIGASHTSQFLDSSLNISVSYVREADNQDSPIDLELTEEDQALIAAAGADIGAAVRSGLLFVGRSDTASGLYRRIDTALNGNPDSIYVYDPSNDAALYDVIFNRAIDGRGDYRNVAFGHYEFVGKGAGEYLPVVYLPLPGIQQVGAFTIDASPVPGLQLDAEIAFSSTDLNRFSSEPSSQQNGIAVRGGGVLEGDSVTVGGINLGKIRGTTNLRFVGNAFRAINRISEPEFARSWNAAGRIGESGLNDLLAEGRLDWKPIHSVEVVAGVGTLQRGDVFSSFRHDYGVRFKDRQFPLAGDYAVELISSDDTISGGNTSYWLKGIGGVSYRAGAFTPGFRLAHQHREDLRIGVDTLLPRAFRFLELGPDLLIDLPLFRTTTSARYRVDDSARFDPAVSTTRFIQDGISQSVSLNGELKGIRSLRSSIDFAWRRRTFDTIPGLDPTSRLENVSILARF